MSLKVGVGGAWKEVPAVMSVGVGGAWKGVVQAWVGVGGAWKSFFVSIMTQLGHTSGYAASTSACTGQYKLDSDGYIYSSNGGIGTYVQRSMWLAYGSASDYEVYCTHTGGEVPAGSATDTWLNLGTDRAWTVASGALNVTKTSNFTLTIRRVSDGLVTTAATAISISAERYS